MEISSLILNVGILFIMMVPGIILKKCNLVSDGFGKGISNLVLYIAQPSLIVYAYISSESSFSEILPNALAVLLLSIPVHLIFTVIAMPAFKKAPDAKRRMLRFATIFSNAAFMGIPLIQVILGAEAAIYASVYNITFNFFLWTLGVYLCTHEEGKDMDDDGDYDVSDMLASASHHTKKSNSLVRVLLHPVTLASVMGVILLAFGVNLDMLASAHLTIISDSLGMLKALVAPLSMLVIGLRLADLDLSGFFSDVYMYIFLALRHVILPLIIVGILFVLNILGVKIGTEAALVTVIMAAVPAASSATMFAEKYDCDAAYVSRLVAVSTILCIATMPPIVMLAQLFI